MEKPRYRDKLRSFLKGDKSSHVPKGSSSLWKSTSPANLAPPTASVASGSSYDSRNSNGASSSSEIRHSNGASTISGEKSDNAASNATTSIRATASSSTARDPGSSQLAQRNAREQPPLYANVSSGGFLPERIPSPVEPASSLVVHSFSADRASSTDIASTEPESKASETSSLPLNDTSSQTSRSEQLWVKAFGNVAKSQPALLAVLENELTQNSETFKDITQLQNALDERLAARDARRWVFEIAGKSIKVREQGEKVVRFVIGANEFITQAVSAEPHAALAWSGVSLILPLLLNNSSQNDAMMSGLDTISKLLPLYRIREELYLPSGTENVDFENALIVLYRRILCFYGSALGYLSRRSLVRAGHNLFTAENWLGHLEDITQADQFCASFTSLLHEKVEHSRLKEFVEHQTKSIDVLEDMRRAFQAYSADKKLARQETDTTNLLESLSSNYQQDKDDIPDRVSGTCEWVTHEPSFGKWYNSRTGVLWISADPGCGKTVLARYLVDEKQLSTSVMTSSLCYFFFKDGIPGRITAGDALAAILHQLYTNHNNPDLIKYALLKLKTRGRTLRTMQTELWNILTETAADPTSGEIICVIDALDECESTSRSNLMKALGRLLKVSSSSSRLKFLITARPYPEIRNQFHEISATASSTSSSCHLDTSAASEQISEDINKFIEDRIPKLAWELDEKLQQQIMINLKKRENRTYLWLDLILEVISKRISAGDGVWTRLEPLIDQLPEKLFDAYGELLDKSPNREYAKIILQIVVGAERPLSVSELNIASSLALLTLRGKSCTTLEASSREKDTKFEGSLRNVCGLVLTVRQSRVYMIHQTAREYILETDEQYIPTERAWQHFSLEEANLTIGQVCMEHLSLLEFSVVQNSFDRFNAPNQQLSVSSAALVQSHSFLTYSANYWTYHFNHMCHHDQLRLLTIAEELMNPQHSHFDIWYTVFLEDRGAINNWEHQADWTPLAIASRFGLQLLVTELLNHGAEVDHIGQFGTALNQAASNGWFDVCEILLAHRADPNIVAGFYYSTALEAAAGQGHARICQLLLEQEADVDLGENCTPLLAAANGGFADVVRLLLLYHARVDLEGLPHGTALIAASRKGHASVVKQLLNARANPNTSFVSDDGHIWTPLGAAAGMGNEEVVDLLLEKKVDVDAPGYLGATALQGACSIGNLSIAGNLIQKGAHVSLQLGALGSPLLLATRLANQELMNMLINNSATLDVDFIEDEDDMIRPSGRKNIVHLAASSSDSKANKALGKILDRFPEEFVTRDESGKTPLHFAVQSGTLDNVDELLRRGADPSATDEIGLTPLHLAMTREDPYYTKLLLLSGADAGKAAARNGGLTPLHLAVIYGRVIALSFILQHGGIDLDAFDISGNNALLFATSQYDVRLIKALIDNGASVNLPHVVGYSPLIEAITQMRGRNMDILLAAGADVHFRTPSNEHGVLHRALNQQTARILEVECMLDSLLKAGADIAQQDARGNTPLHLAAEEGRLKCAELLVERKAPLGMLNNQGQTPFALALECSHEEVARYLWRMSSRR